MDLREQATQFAHEGQEEFITESPNILIVEGNPDISSIMAEDKKDETRGKRTGSLAVQGEKNKPESSASKKDEASGTLTDSHVIKENKSESNSPISSAIAKGKGNPQQRKFFLR